ncbi:MAG: hypothetical protein DCC65_02280 [Planctomycetota bacterium]|nr:MAG: hypothetical protein DCC65_02280 [Planctomycetota bacterium]
MNRGRGPESEEVLMAAQHHHDEYTMTDIRHTLGEVWRVVRDRRWYFIAPSCVITTIALLCSVWVPRTYTASTIVKREQDPVLASMMGQAWTEPYGEIRKRIASDMADIEFVAEALDELDLPRGLQRFENGELTPASAARRAALAREVREGLKVTSIDSSSSRDIVEMTLSLHDATHLTEILSHLRDKYARLAKKKTGSILRDAQKFFQAESDKCRARLAGLEKQLREFEARYPGIDPQVADPTLVEQAALVTERIELEGKIKDLSAQREELAASVEKLAADCSDAAAGMAGVSGVSVNAGGALTQEVPHVPNPAIAEVMDEIRVLEDELLTAKSIRLMTDQHPAVVRIRRTLDARRAELASLPATVPDLSPTRNTAPAGPTPLEQAETRLAHADTKLAAARARIDEISTRIGVMERRRLEAVDQREAYLKIRQQADRTRGELDGWQANLGPIGHVLTLEDSDRGIMFSVLRDTARAPKPASPNAMLVLLVCVAIGAAAGGITVVSVELLDHSFRTVKQLGSTLGVPVIEGVDEILTRQKRRRRLVRKLVLMPAVATVLVVAVAVAGAVAFLSIEQPDRLEQIRQSPGKVYEIAMGADEV